MVEKWWVFCSFSPHRMRSFLVFCCWLCSLPSLAYGIDRTEIRILLQEGVSQVTIRSSQAYQVVAAAPVRLSRVERGTLTIVGQRKGMLINKRLFPGGHIELRPRHPSNLFQIGPFRYRGTLQIRLDSAGKLQVINLVSLRYYLYGVLPQEISPAWKKEALKAQAVAARTFTLYRKAVQSEREYDVKAEVWDQVYRGYNGEDLRTNQAVDETMGEILTYAGHPIAAYYHADSGGYTEDSQYVWSVQHPYLRAVRSLYGADSPHAVWEVTLSLAEIEQVLRLAGYSVGAIQKLTILERSPTGRVLWLQVHHSHGDVTLKGTEFRLLLGVNRVRSTLFTLRQNGSKIRFVGRGWGHGVGLSQWGAKEMAELGFTYQEILQFYYQGATLTQLTQGEDKP